MYRNEIKQKTQFRVVDTSNKQIGDTGILIQLRGLWSLWISVSYGFCEFNRVANWNRGKTIIFVWLSFQICNWKYCFHIQRRRMSNVILSVPKSNFEGRFGTNVWQILVSGSIESWHLIVGPLDICYEKKYLFFRMSGV